MIAEDADKRIGWAAACCGIQTFSICLMVVWPYFYICSSSGTHFSKFPFKFAAPKKLGHFAGIGEK